MGRLNYSRLPTEQRHSRSGRLDLLSPLQIVTLMNHEDQQVLRAIAAARKAIAVGADIIAQGLLRGGRLFFVGAGTSGRLGVMEAAECPPTFNTTPQQVQALMAGGRSAVFRSKEGAEDSEGDAIRDVRRRVRRGDVVVGIAASGVTPFVRAALRAGRQQGARAILLTCNKKSALPGADLVIALDTGPEILTGSTRLKAGSACKMALNMLTTASMVRLGKVYGNRMVDLQPKSRKLVERGLRLIRELGRVSPAEAQRLFKAADRHVKVAILMARNHVSVREARRRLTDAGGHLRKVLE